MNVIVKMLLTLGIVGIISGASLSELSKWANPKIAQHRKEDTEKAIFLVQPKGKSYEQVTNAGFELYKVTDESNNLIGYALPYEGNGFQGKIRLMVGVNPDITQVTALEILEQVETPGLGTKVTEEPFREQFINLQCNPRIDWVKGMPPTKDNEIQAITGATISSKSVVAILNDGLSKLRKLKESGAAL